MIEAQFREFLGNDPGITSKDIAVRSRVAKAEKAEEILCRSLDEIVANDDLMYDSLVALQAHEDPKHNPMQNAVRKYYIFKNGRAFPQLRYYKR